MSACSSACLCVPPLYLSSSSPGLPLFLLWLSVACLTADPPSLSLSLSPSFSLCLSLRVSLSPCTWTTRPCLPLSLPGFARVSSNDNTTTSNTAAYDAASVSTLSTIAGRQSRPLLTAPRTNGPPIHKEELSKCKRNTGPSCSYMATRNEETMRTSVHQDGDCTVPRNFT